MSILDVDVKKIETYIALVIKIAVIIFIAGQVYNKLTRLQLVIGANSKAIIELKVHDAINQTRLRALEREIYER